MIEFSIAFRLYFSFLFFYMLIRPCFCFLGKLHALKTLFAGENIDLYQEDLSTQTHAISVVNFYDCFQFNRKINHLLQFLFHPRQPVCEMMLLLRDQNGPPTFPGALLRAGFVNFFRHLLQTPDSVV